MHKACHMSFHGHVLKITRGTPKKVKWTMRVSLEIPVVTSRVKKIPYLVDLAGISMLF